MDPGGQMIGMECYDYNNVSNFLWKEKNIYCLVMGFIIGNKCNGEREEKKDGARPWTEQ